MKVQIGRVEMGRSSRVGRRLSAIGLMTLLLCGIGLAQPGGGSSSPGLKQKIAALKQSAAANQQKLHKYQ